jgi:hypothetical protein
MTTPRLWTLEDGDYTTAEVAARLRLGWAGAQDRLKRATAQHPRGRIPWSALGIGAPPTRNQRICAFVASLGRTASHDEVVAALRPHEPTLGRKLNTVVSAHLHQLVLTGKLKRTGRARHYRYGPTAHTLVDRRLGAAVPAPKPRRTPQAATPAPQPQPRVAPSTRTLAAAAPTTTTRRPGEFQITRPHAPPPVVVVPNPALAKPQRTVLDSDQIAADIAAFEARGGHVERLAHGASSKPLRSVLTEAAFTAVTERTWRERQLREAARATTARARNDATFDDATTDVA